MTTHKIKKLPLVNADGTVLGLVTAKDLLKHGRHPFATRDERGRLRVGAAVGARAITSSGPRRCSRPAPMCSSSTSRTATRW